MPLRPASLSLQNWEERNFGDTNPGIGARVLKVWSFPSEIVESIASRYTEPTSNTIFAAGSGMFLASCIAEKIPAGLPFEKGIFLPPARLEELGFSKDEFADLKLEITQKLSRMQAMMNL
jgi:HD-like signal output (HDOD) protein